MSQLRLVSGANHIAPTRLADGKTSLDPLRSVQFSTGTTPTTVSSSVDTTACTTRTQPSVRRTFQADEPLACRSCSLTPSPNLFQSSPPQHSPLSTQNPFQSSLPQQLIIYTKCHLSVRTQPPSTQPVALVLAIFFSFDLACTWCVPYVEATYCFYHIPLSSIPHKCNPT